MGINKQRLKIALSTIRKDKEGYFLSGRFVDLLSAVHIKVAQDIRPHEDFLKLNRYLNFIQTDISNLETIVLRLAWQKDLWAQKRLDESRWMDFAKCDINYFYVEFRSIFDYLSRIIRIVSDSPEAVPSKSFADLRKWLTKSDKRAQKVGKDLAQLVFSVEWFDDLKDIRDSIIHGGGFLIVFPEKDRILFQVHEGIKRKVLIPETMFNENVVDFELYAGLHIGYLIAYLEEASELILNRLRLSGIGNPKSYHSGLRIVRDWVKQVELTK